MRGHLGVGKPTFAYLFPPLADFPPHHETRTRVLPTSRQSCVTNLIKYRTLFPSMKQGQNPPFRHPSATIPTFGTSVLPTNFNTHVHNIFKGNPMSSRVGIEISLLYHYRKMSSFLKLTQRYSLYLSLLTPSFTNLPQNSSCTVP